MHKNELAVKKTFNRLKEYYDKCWDPAGHTLHVGLFGKGVRTLEQAYAAATEDLVGRLDAALPFDADSAVLDVGCGTGRTLLTICERFGASGVGIDISEAQIEDASKALAQRNRERKRRGLTPLRATFICGTANNLESVRLGGRPLSHIISQDAVFLVRDKRKLFESLYRLLRPGGMLGVVDFLAEDGPASSRERELVYELVRWKKGLSFDMYRHLLTRSGFMLVTANRRDAHMVRTYRMLADAMSARLTKSDDTYRELRNRFGQIASSAKTGKMGWALFLAKKNPLTALIAGTKPGSIGRCLGKELRRRGWDVWLYGRHAERLDRPGWHERRCNISSEAGIGRLLKEAPRVDLSIFSADTGCHYRLEELKEGVLKQIIDAKVTGSLLLAKALVTARPTMNDRIKMVWLGGKTGVKEKSLIAYSLINSGLAAFIEALNRHYREIAEAYYLTIPLISPSTLGDAYIRKTGPASRKYAYHPRVVAEKILAIADGRLPAGVIESKEKAV